MPKTKYDVVNIGGAVRDITLYTTDGYVFERTTSTNGKEQVFAFPHGGKTSISNEDGHFTLGGGAANTSVSMSRLGLRTAALTAVGHDLIGQDVINDLESEGVDTSLVQRIKGVRSAISIIVASKKDNDHIIFTYRGASQRITLTAGDLKKIPTKWFYITSLAGSQKHWHRNLDAIFTAARNKGINVAWNIGGTQIKTGKKGVGKYIKHTTCLMLNTSEAKSLVGSASAAQARKVRHLKRNASMFRYLAEQLHNWGAKTVVITDSANGAYAYNGKVLMFRTATPKKALDTTGAGDGFNSSFITGQIKFPDHPKNLAISLELGRMNTDSLIRRQGAQAGLLTWSEIVPRLKQDIRQALKP